MTELQHHVRVTDGLTKEQLLEVARAAGSFRVFLNYWFFVDQDTGKVRNLGEELWPAQEQFVEAADEHPWVFFLKARQLGESTIACAYDGWRQRFGPRNARVHIFHKREKDAQSLLERVRFGLEHLPPHFRLPVNRQTMSEYELDAGEDDVRRAIAYPADTDTSRGDTCIHAHVDEWAFMGNPARVWQSIEPSAAGTVHLLTTGIGPENFTSIFYRKCMAGDAKNRDGDPILPCFIDALKRPDRDQAWLDGKRAGMDEDAFRREYAMTWQDALSGGGEYVFRSNELDRAAVDCLGLMPPQPGRKYSVGWDIGRHADAAVGVVLDVTEDVHDVVAYLRLREQTYPRIQLEIEDMYRAYKGVLGVEKNAAGEAVLENLSLAEHVIDDAKFITSKASKARIISQLRLAFQNETLKYDPAACPQLDVELRGYQEPDDNVVQDSVMALAIAEEYAAKAHSVGRVLGVRTW